MKKYLRPTLLIVSILLIISMGRNIASLLSRADTIEEARERVEELKKEQAELLQVKERVESEEFIEKEAREKLGLAKSGETVVVLPDEEILRRIAPNFEQEEFVEKLPIWKRWVRMFF